MTRSVNEVMVLATKAARGAGAPPAQASEFGRAVVKHIHAKRDFTMISDALNVLPSGPIMDLPIAFSRMLECEDTPVKGQVDPNGWMPLALSYAAALPFAAEVSVTGGVLYITADIQSPANNDPIGRLILPDDLIDEMTNLAARILVPESDASRLAGAGAGLTDND